MSKLTKQKVIVLQTFIHSRLKGLMSDSLEQGKSAVKSDEDKDLLVNRSKMIVTDLEKKGYTVENLNRMPNSPLAAQLTYYYEVALKALERVIKKDEEMIEAAIGFYMLDYLGTEKQIINKVDVMECYDCYYGGDKSNSKLAVKMMNVSDAVIDAVRKANYITYVKQLRRNK